MNTGKIIELNELKMLQMDILENIHHFCVENNIKYSMACGTLLGAARHKGYIPWDDDIDIYIPREDYEKLIKIFPKDYKGRYKIVSITTEQGWNRPYAKAVDFRTELFEPGDDYVLGVNIDIFPIDDVPDNNEDWAKFDRIRRMLYQWFVFSYFTENHRKPYKRVIKRIVRMAMEFVKYRYHLVSMFNSYIQRYNKKGYNRCFECCMGVNIRSPFPKELFQHLVEMPFEDKKFLGFEDYDQYLTSSYGNWRKLPPEDKRVSHHTFKAYWK